ncbi:hypothetical protein [Cohnella hashimotonis]|uniref:Uncharacterized protein n=1 Tax=Cohnella hashimotonis TaxID=2826895 RepID=A0ABT6TRS9_9BACL|nr:hypothetical protein [Cohnella hashimotonis]MDI4649562.1 hypothetical protein [Cohnella hashimotonis]
MNKKTVLKAAGLFVAGLAGGIGIMLSNDAYKAVNDALGNSTSNALALSQQKLTAQQAQIGQIAKDAEALKQQAAASGKEAEATQQSDQQLQQQIQQQIQQMIQQIQQMLQQMQQSQTETMKALTKV